ncbi:MAG: phytanoyl-CoA dioxygenase family protein [Chitinophagales bacterium]|nr:phytanoyl-CoA dioxygenase family protein [Chitinophagales bacterium]
MIEDVFFDKQLNTQLSKLGYVKFPFLNEPQLKVLSEFYEKIHANNAVPFTTFMINDYVYRKAIDEQIKSVFAPLIRTVFKRHTPFWGNFFSKLPGQPQMPLHSDLQYVDETTDISLNIWVPLSKTNSTTATLGIVPKSNTIMNQIRGVNIIDAYSKNADDIAERFVQYLDFEPGEAIIYDHRLLHLSAKNDSNQTRVAATLVMVPATKPVQMYFAEKEGDTTFYGYHIKSIDELLLTPFKKLPSHLIPIKTIKNYQFVPLTVNDVQKFVAKISTPDQL